MYISLLEMVLTWCKNENLCHTQLDGYINQREETSSFLTFTSA